MATKFGRRNPWPAFHALMESEVSQSQSEAKLLRNVLWLQNLVKRKSDKNVMHCWGQPEVNLLRNVLWLPNLVRRTLGRTPDQSVVYCWDQRFKWQSYWVNQRSICLQMPYGFQIWSEKPDHNVNIVGVKAHAGVVLGQAGVNLLTKCHMSYKKNCWPEHFVLQMTF